MNSDPDVIRMYKAFLGVRMDTRPEIAVLCVTVHAPMIRRTTPVADHLLATRRTTPPTWTSRQLA